MQMSTACNAAIALVLKTSISNAYRIQVDLLARTKGLCVGQIACKWSLYWHPPSVSNHARCCQCHANPGCSLRC